MLSSLDKERLMSWHSVSTMSLRADFIRATDTPSESFAAVCRRFGISRKTGYKWCQRYAQAGAAGLTDHSRRPHHAPQRLANTWVQQILALRQQHPAWGALKIQACLAPAGTPGRPSTSTINRVLREHGCITAEESAKHHAWHRFEHPTPNALWQMDFKGAFALPLTAQRCHALTVLDDHSRFALGLFACANEQTATVQACLTEVFRRYGIPERMTMDNGAPWGDTWGQPYTPLTVWLLRVGIGVSHSRPYHPQTQGKDERFHRTLKAELLRTLTASDLAAVQAAFDRWRAEYNTYRPHQALGMQVPQQRYTPSGRPFPEALPPLEYAAGLTVRKVQQQGRFSLQGREFRVSKAFRGYPIGLQPTATDGVWTIWFGTHLIGQLDLHVPTA
jgi:transposase InsO family protein